MPISHNYTNHAHTALRNVSFAIIFMQFYLVMTMKICNFAVE